MQIVERSRELGSERRDEGNDKKTVPLIWKGVEYPRIEPGKYRVRGVMWQGPEWLRQYSRWSIRIEFALVSEPVSVSVFFNMGPNPNGPHIGRQSKYWKAWVMANGGLPLRGQDMSPKIFVGGQFFEVTVAYATLNSDRAEKDDSEVYSRITEFHSVTWV